jgi:hypothetical protein
MLLAASAASLELIETIFPASSEYSFTVSLQNSEHMLKASPMPAEPVSKSASFKA